ncbi:MAG TPA: DNA glycosylase [Clostridia bacterium]|nr:DNA glycosylase [Clostridia bacterium]
MEKIVLDKIDSFDLKHIFDCGQCFRWNNEIDGSYTGIVYQYVINIKNTEKNKVEVKFYANENITQKDMLEFCSKYFDLERDYKKIKQELSVIDENMKKSIDYGDGIRILNQDLWETVISYIISANNNIPRIKGIIENLSKNFGNKIEVEGKEYYTFPTPYQLSKATVSDLRQLGLGFRDIRVYETTQIFLNNKIEIENLGMKTTKKLKEILISLPGVGPKVADCILLFSYLKRTEVFPVDVWIRRVINDLYLKCEDENKINNKDIEKLANEKFGDLAGIAQQYLYYWKRDQR